MKTLAKLIAKFIFLVFREFKALEKEHYEKDEESIREELRREMCKG